MRRAAALPEVAAIVRPREDVVALVVALMARSCGHGPTAGRVAARLKRIAVTGRLEAAEAARPLAG